MKLAVRKDVGTPQQPGQIRACRNPGSCRSQSGAHELVAAEARGPNGEAASCGIGAEDVDGEEVRQDLVKALKLGAPLRANRDRPMARSG